MARARSITGRGVGVLCGLLLLVMGCARQSSVTGFRQAHGGVAPVLVVERFLNAANATDLDAMARLFGTRDGSIVKRGPRAEVEARMYALASILRHKNYQLEGEGIVPGRLGEAVRLVIRLELEDRQVSVPFVVVQTRDDGWLIEQIGIDRITAGGAL